MIALFQNINPSKILQHINERAHSLKCERDFYFNFWGSNSFKLEEQIVSQPPGHLLTLSPVNPTEKDIVMERPRQLGYTPLSKRQNEEWKTFEGNCRQTQSLHQCICFK